MVTIVLIVDKPKKKSVYVSESVSDWEVCAFVSPRIVRNRLSVRASCAIVCQSVHRVQSFVSPCIMCNRLSVRVSCAIVCQFVFCVQSFVSLCYVCNRLSVCVMCAIVCVYVYHVSATITSVCTSSKGV